jgi:hypothetical protein
MFWSDYATGFNMRKGVRNGAFVIDREAYPYGFNDAEGIGWTNVSKIIYS